MGMWTWRPGKHWLLMAVLLGLCPAGGCKEGTWSLWSAYSARFIDGQGRVIDRSSGDRTTSEGQAYAMFFALVGNDRASFDRLLEWTQKMKGPDGGVDWSLKIANFNVSAAGSPYLTDIRTLAPGGSAYPNEFIETGGFSANSEEMLFTSDYQNHLFVENQIYDYKLG